MATSLEARLIKKVPFVLRDVDPTADDIHFVVPSVWLNREEDTAFLLLDVTTTVATWLDLSTIKASNVMIEKIGEVTYDDIQDWLNLTQSAGLLTGGEITDGGSGTVDVAAGTGFIKTTDSAIGETLFFNWEASAGLVLTDLETNTVYINYNIVTEAVTVVATTTPSTINHTTQIATGTVYRCGTDVHILVGGNRYYNISRRVHERLRAVDGIIRASGLVTSEIGTRNISMTEGVLYAGVNKAVISAIDTSGLDVFTSWYYDGDLGTPAWVSIIDQIQIDNLQYNAIATGLANLGVAKYGVHWVYADNDGHIQIVYGQGSYNLLQAQQVSPPSSLPCIVADFSTIIAKIIIGQNSATFTEISYPFTTQFSTSLAAIHNELTGLQGGTAGEYYHLAAIGFSGNDFAIGDGEDTDKTLLAQNADATKPALRYNATTNKWEYSNDGVSYSNFSTAVVSDTEVAKYKVADGETISVGDYEQIFLAEIYIIEGTLNIACEGILAIH